MHTGMLFLEKRMLKCVLPLINMQFAQQSVLKIFLSLSGFFGLLGSWWHDGSYYRMQSV